MPNILIVDDSPFARNGIRRHLAETGFDLREAGSGLMAIEAARFQTPDLVTLDLLMPEMSGLETLLELRKISTTTKFVIISADIQTITRQELAEAGAHAFLNKPVSRSDLVETIAQLLNSSNKE
jgi:two-component system chemotaxis response regulator CheY